MVCKHRYLYVFSHYLVLTFHKNIQRKTNDILKYYGYTRRRQLPPPFYRLPQKQKKISRNVSTMVDYLIRSTVVLTINTCELRMRSLVISEYYVSCILYRYRIFHSSIHGQIYSTLKYA